MIIFEIPFGHRSLTIDFEVSINFFKWSHELESQVSINFSLEIEVTTNLN